MKHAETPLATPQTFVVTVIFATYRTVRARSVSEALDMAQETLVEEGATKQDLVNWHAHEVNRGGKSNG